MWHSSGRSVRQTEGHRGLRLGGSTQGTVSLRRPWRPRSRVPGPPEKYMKRSRSLDLFTYLWGRALSAQTSSRAHPAPTSTRIARRSPAAKVELWSSLALWCTRGSTTAPIRSGDIGMPVRGHGQDTINAAGFDSQSGWDCPRCKHTQKKGDVSDFVHVKSPVGHLAILT
jgi:hypothetical protein